MAVYPDPCTLEIHARHVQQEIERSAAAQRLTASLPTGRSRLRSLRIALGHALVAAGAWLDGSSTVASRPSSVTPLPCRPVIRALPNHPSTPTPMRKPATG